MKMKNRQPGKRVGFTLLELMVATAMLATLSVACMTLVRTSYTAWLRHETDHESRQQGIAVLRHIVRQVRQAQSVVAISDPSETSGNLALLMKSGDIYVWQHNASTKQVLFGVDTANDLLATGVDQLSFLGIRADGYSTTTDPSLVHSVIATTKVNVVRPGGNETVTTTCQGWLRSW